MGIYLNPGNEKFIKAVNSEIYVDKSELIKYTNHVLNTMQQYICVSRPRRFGKSIAANMLTAYYSRGCDSKELFAPYKISQAESFEKQHNTDHDHDQQPDQSRPGTVRGFRRNCRFFPVFRHPAIIVITHRILKNSKNILRPIIY